MLNWLRVSPDIQMCMNEKKLRITLFGIHSVTGTASFVAYIFFLSFQCVNWNCVTAFFSLVRKKKCIFFLNFRLIEWFFVLWLNNPTEIWWICLKTLCISLQHVNMYSIKNKFQIKRFSLLLIKNTIETLKKKTPLKG